MGTDDGLKPRGRLPFWIRKWKGIEWKNIAIAITIGILFVVVVNTLYPPERILTESFNAKSRLQKLPAQCQELAERFYQCQETSKYTWVMGCHRKWCNSFGHCEPVGGLGDRTRFLLSQVEEAADHCVKIELDMSAPGMALLDSAIYTDPAGWLAELAHYRSYSVSDRLPPSKSHYVNGVRYTHFTPDHYYLEKSTNICYFHMLFRPDRELQDALDRHNSAIGGRSIGIHYRTGDVAAFGLNNHDTRVVHWQEDWQKMLKCAETMAGKLFPKHADEVTFFLATDNRAVKEHAQKLDARGRRIYTTEIEPASYLQGPEADLGAWMEIHLLAARHGLVANVHGNSAPGKRDQVSQFSLLARKIGYLSADQFMECDLD